MPGVQPVRVDIEGPFTLDFPTRSRVADLESAMDGVSIDAPSDEIDNSNRFGGGGYTLDYAIWGQAQVAIPSPQTTSFLQILGDTLTASWVGSMPTTQPANGVVIDVTKQRLYFSGSFAG